MITAEIDLSTRQVLILFNAIEGFKAPKLSSGDRVCLGGVLRKIRKAGKWDAETKAMDALDYKEVPQLDDKGAPVVLPDGTPATIHVYQDMKAPFPEWRLSPEERGAIFRMLLTLVDAPECSAGSAAEALEMASWLGLDQAVEKAVYKVSHVECFEEVLDG